MLISRIWPPDYLTVLVITKVNRSLILMPIKARTFPHGHERNRTQMEEEELLASDTRTEVFKRRWLILAIFCLLSFSNAGQWISFAPISNIVHQYYQVSLFAVNCLSMIYMAVYIVFIIPASWILDTYGLKVSTVLGATFNALGAWLKFCGSFSDGFHWVLVGQTFAALAQCFILGVPPRLAAAWFGERERSTATALGVFANQVGVAVYFVVIPHVVLNSSKPEEQEIEFQYVYGGLGIFCSLVGALVLIAFESSPPSPPSASQAVLIETQEEDKLSHKEAVRSLMRNPSYVILLISYGLYCGVMYTTATLLAQLLRGSFPNSELLIGFLGFAFLISGLPGTVLIGLWLDKTFAYKKGTIFLVGFAFFAQGGFTLYVEFGKDIHWLFPIIVLFGFFGTSLLPLGFEFAAELTYPVPEGTSAGLLNTSAQLCGIILIAIVGVIIEKFSVLCGNVILVGALLVAVGILPFIKSDLQRNRIDMPNR